MLCVCVCVCVCVHATLCACVFTMLCVIFVCSFLYVLYACIDLYNYGYLSVVCFSLSRKVLQVYKSAL